MTLEFYEPVLPDRSSPTFTIHNVKEIHLDSREVQVTIGARTCCVAWVESRRSPVMYTLHHAGLEALFGSPVLDARSSPVYYAMKIEA